MPIPKSMPKSERIYAETETLKHIKKPDVDNLIKLYLDVMNTLVYEDDNCVSINKAQKVYSMQPRTLIFIEETTRFVTQQEMYSSNYSGISG